MKLFAIQRNKKQFCSFEWTSMGKFAFCFLAYKTAIIWVTTGVYKLLGELQTLVLRLPPYWIFCPCVWWYCESSQGRDMATFYVN